MAITGKRQGTYQREEDTVTALSDVALNGAASTRTFTVDARGHQRVRIYVAYTHSNNGALTLTLTDSPDQGTTYFTPYAGSTLVADNTQATGSLSADASYSFEWTVRGMKDLKFVISHGGSADANDVVTVSYVLFTI